MKVYALGTTINYNPVTDSVCSNPGSSTNGCLKFYVLHDPGSSYPYLELITAETFNYNNLTYPQTDRFMGGINWQDGPYLPDGDYIAYASGHNSVEDSSIRVPEWLKGYYWTGTDAGTFGDGPDASWIRPRQYVVANYSLTFATSDESGEKCGVRLGTGVSKDDLN